MLRDEIRTHIIRPTLQVANLWSECAEILVYGTGIVESNYQHIIQIGNPAGGALGFFQMEAATFKDHCKWLDLFPQKNVKNNILAACYYVSMPIDPFVLISNIKFAALLCRAHYLRVPKPLPPANDAAALSQYHKKYYNTALGKADPESNAKIFQEIIDGKL